MKKKEFTDKDISDICFEILDEILAKEKNDIISSSKVLLNEESRKDYIKILKHKLTPIQKKAFEIELYSRLQNLDNQFKESQITNKFIFLISAFFFGLISYGGIYLIIEYNFYLVLKIFLGIFSILWFIMSFMSLVKFFKRITIN